MITAADFLKWANIFNLKSGGGGGSGTVTSITAGTGLTGGTITTSGTIALEMIPSDTIMSNLNGTSLQPTGNTLTEIIDAVAGNVQGQILYRNASVWTVLPAGTTGQFLQTQGSSANPQWASPAGSGTINAGSINQLTYYAATGTVVSGLPTLANGVLVTNSVSAPSISTTLPSGLTIPGYANAPTNNNITSLIGLTGAIRQPVSIQDTSGNNILSFIYTSSPVNYFTIQNSPTGLPPTLSVTGSDANVSMGFQTKGGIAFIYDSLATSSGKLRLYNAAATQFTGLTVSPSQSTSVDFVLPSIDGSNGQVLTTDGSGNLSFQTSGGGGGVTSTQIQEQAFTYNVASGIGGANFTLSISPSPASYTDGMIVSFKSLNTSTSTSPTLNVNGLGAVPIVATLFADPIPLGFILNDSSYLAIYNSSLSKFVLINPAVPPTGSVNSGTINDLAYYSSTGISVSGLATVNNSSLSTNSIGAPTWIPLTDGQIVIGSSSGAPLSGNLTAGAGITITNASNSITISSSGGGNNWVDETSSSVSMVTNTGYTSDDGATLVTFTLPTIAEVGDWLEVNGLGSGLYKIAQNSGQQIVVSGVAATTTGITGYLASVNQYDCVRLRCLVANTIFTVVNQQSTGITVF